MAIYYCKECTSSQEVRKEHIGKNAKCPKCKSSIKIYDTVIFVSRLTKRNLFQGRELFKIKQDLKNKEELELEKLKEIEELTKKIEELNKTILPNNELKVIDKAIKNININNTKEFTKSNKYIAIEKWFKEKNIKVDIDISNVDTTGFFDEIAETIGNNYKILKPLMNQIQYIQNHDYSNLKFKLADKSPKDIQIITAFCNELYKYSFVSRYSYDKKLKIIWLNIQQAPKIKAFFNGIWMEWFIMVKIFKLFKDNNMDVSLMRSINIIKSNEQTNELDIFILTKENMPIYIECKTGEFREDINKYLKLQKILGISKENFIICILDLNNSYLDGLTSMYDLKFTNENEVIKYLEKILI